MFDAYEFVKRVADNSLKGLEINEGDYYEDGYWICGKCGERKQEQVEMEGHEPILRARQCRCMREVLKREEEEKKRREEEDRIKYLRETCGLGERYRDARFENWREDLRKEKSYRYCKSYAERFDEMLKKNQGLLLWGDVGSGKSWAAACITNYLVDHGISACMTSSMSIVEDDMKLSMAKLLVIDDFGAERIADLTVKIVVHFEKHTVAAAHIHSFSSIAGNRSAMGIRSYKTSAAEKNSAEIACYNNADIGKSTLLQNIENRHTCRTLRFAVIGISGNIVVSEDIGVYIMLCLAMLCPD